MSFYSETPVKSVRKARPCVGCGAIICVGEPAVNCAGHYDGSFWSATYHADCREAEVGLNKLHDIRWDDEWIRLDEIEWDDWPWLIETYPAVAERRRITTKRYHEILDHHRRTRAAFYSRASS